VVLDEYASMRPEAWMEVLRPALADRMGRALFIGTPKGLNHFYDLYQHARTQPEWAAFQFTTEQGGNVASAELQSAAAQLDERRWRQEFQASFENLGAGLVYYVWLQRNQNIGHFRGRTQVLAVTLSLVSSRGPRRPRVLRSDYG